MTETWTYRDDSWSSGGDIVGHDDAARASHESYDGTHTLR